MEYKEFNKNIQIVKNYKYELTYGINEFSEKSYLIDMFYDGNKKYSFEEMIFTEEQEKEFTYFLEKGTPMLIFAYELAKKYHCNQLDKAGVLYTEHLKFVSFRCENIDEKVIGMLHDIIEDTDLTLKELKELFPDYICNAVDLLTKKDNQEIEEYIKGLKTNSLALKVKIQDLINNMNFSRMKYNNPSLKDAKRLQKYGNMIFELVNYLESIK